MIKRSKFKKGFTLVELIIVIGIVAILAAVSVIGYFVFFEQSNESADIQLVTQLNKILKADEISNGKRDTFYEVNTQILEINGIKSTQIITKSKNNYIVYDQENNRFALVKNDTNEVIFTDEDTSIYKARIKQKNNFKTSHKYDKWVVVTDENHATSVSQKGYAIYLSDNYVGDNDLDVYSSIDVGKIGINTLDSISYYKNVSAQKVLVRTNGGEFNIITYFDDDNGNIDEFIHYGKCDSLDIPDEIKAQFNELGTSEEAIKISKKLANTSFLYRLGNQNKVSLDSLFKKETNNALSSEKAEISIKVLEGNVGYDIEKNENDILKSTIKFENDGIIELDFKYNSTIFTQNFEICDGYNCLTYNDVSDVSSHNSGKSIFLNDITMSNGQQLYLYNGAAIDGNGFIFDVTNAATSHVNSQGKYLESNSYVIALSGNNILDNIKIIGKPYNDVSLYAAKENNFPVVAVLGKDNVIANSFIANCFAPVRMRGENLTITNTTLSGGSFCNLDIRNGDVILEDLTTINQTSYSDGSLGLGITSWYEGVSSAKIILKEKLRQYNYVTSNDAQGMGGINKTVINKILYTEPYYSTGNDGIKYANTGIICMNSNTQIIDERNDNTYFLKQNVTFYQNEGLGYSIKNPSKIDIPGKYEPSNNLGLAPKISVAFPQKEGDKNYVPLSNESSTSCFTDNNNIINVNFSYGESFTFDMDIIEIKKYDKTIDVENISILSDGLDVSSIIQNNKAVFTKSGNYQIIYEYEDNYNYKGDLTSYKISYNKIITVSVTAIEANNDPTITLYNNKCEVVHDLGNNKYLVEPTVDSSNQNHFETYYYSKEKVNINVAIYECNNYSSKTKKTKDKTDGKNVYLFHEIIGGFAEIIDYDGNNNQNKITGNNQDFSFYDGYEKNGKNDTKDNLFDWDADPHSCDSLTIDNVFYYVNSSPADPARSAGYFYAFFSYKANNSKTYIYGVKYVTPAKEKKPGGCFTSDTLITLENGTQKEIQYVTKDDKIMAYNMYEGRFEASSIIGLINHGCANYDLLKCTFSNGETFKILEKHGLYDYDLNAFIYIEPSNYESYLGHRFVAYNGNKTSYDIVTLDSVELSKEYTCAYSIVSSVHMSAVTENILSATPKICVAFWVPKKDKLLYDTDALNAIINQYGTYDYSLFKDYLTYDQFIGFNVPLLKAPVEMGLLTFDDLIKMIEDNKEFIV